MYFCSLKYNYIRQMVPLRRKITTSFILTILFLLLTNKAIAQQEGNIEPVLPIDSLVTTAAIDGDNMIDDSLHIPNDSSIVVQTDSLKKQPKSKKQPLDAPVFYEANDSIVFTQEGYAHLYGEGKVTYENIELEAETITMNMDSSTVFARGLTDSLDVIKGRPVFKDGETPYESETIRYNFKSKKGFIHNIVTQQGEGYVTSYNAKKGAEDEIFMQSGRYTTCDHHDNPHFYFQMTTAKVKPKKNVVAGPAYLVVEDVPLPIAVPFFFFPFTSSYSSGVIMPTYMDDYNRGFGLTRGGYYFAMSDIMDLKLTGDIFTKGSWALGLETNYNKRYRYSGSLHADYQVTKLGDKGLPDFSVAKDFKVVWSHRQDAKANPFSTFSAQVNFATSSYERSNIDNLYDSNLLTQNTKTSSVSYSRSFPDQGVTLSSTFNIAQTMRDSSIAVTLPDLNITMSRKFPFKRKRSAGDEKWYEKISLSYSGRMTNSIKTKDNELFQKSLVKDWTNGMQHNVPISATFSLFKHFNLSPSVSYTERWYSKKIMKEYDQEQKMLLPTDTIYGFHRVYNYNASLSLNTKLYGMYKPMFMKSKDIQIRHVFTPQVSLSAAPDFGASRFGYHKEYTDANGNQQYYSPYSEQPFGVPGRGKQGVVSFDVSNNIEMKYKTKSDSVVKRSLIDELGASLSYNFAAEKRPWSDLSMRLRLKLSKNYTFNLNSSFATYAYQFDKNGNVYVGDRTEWSYGRFGRFQGWGSSFTYSFNNDTWKKWFGKKDDKQTSDTPPATDDWEDDSEYDTAPKKTVKEAEADSDGYQVFKMPWSLNVNYSFNIREDTSKPINEKTMRYPYKYTHNINASGNIKISNRWTINFSTGYDFTVKEVTQTSMSVSRDLHCFNMSASISPFGRWKYYNFTIRANASMLQDLKWDQRSHTQSNIQWY